MWNYIIYKVTINFKNAIFTLEVPPLIGGDNISLSDCSLILVTSYIVPLQVVPVFPDNVLLYWDLRCDDDGPAPDILEDIFLWTIEWGAFSVPEDGFGVGIVCLLKTLSFIKFWNLLAKNPGRWTLTVSPSCTKDFQ